jgi:hypothetical protein
MGRDFMTTLDDLFNQSWMAFGDPGQNKKGSSGLITSEKIEQFAGVRGYPTLKGSPMPPANRGVESGYLEVFFDVEC